METNILKQINEEKQSFEDKDIQIVPGLLFNQRRTIHQTYFYYLSQFQSGEIDIDGDKKYFFNIVKNPSKVFSKSIDFDTKHINILTAGGGSPEKTWYFERDLKHWMKDRQFGEVLNRIFMELPIFGSVVLKIIDGKIHFVDLRNYIVEQSADSLDVANYIIEKHPYTVMEFKKVAKEMNWDKTKVKEAIDKFREMKDVKHIMVYERYGEAQDSEGNWDYRRIYIADVGVSEEDEHQKVNFPYKGVELDSTIIEKHPYWEFHLEKIPGRWLGVGVVESLFEPQIRENELANLQAKASYWRGIVLFKSLDPGMGGKNLVTDSRNGDVLDTSAGDLNQLDISDRNLAFFNEETQKWLANRDELTFSFDVIQGERLPSGTPLGSARLAAAMAGSYFDQIRETIALRVKEMLYAVILPQFEKEQSKEHILRIAGEDLDKVQDMIIKQKATDSLFDFIKNKGKLPTKELFEITKAVIGEKVKQGKEILQTIPKDFYKGIKYALEITITGESKDTAVYAATLFAGLQAVTADPTMLTDPTKKKFFFKWLEAGGVSPNDLVSTEKPSVEQLTQTTPVKGAGGGVSRPAFTPPGTPAPGAQATL